VRDWYHIFDTTKHNFWLRIRHIFDGQPKQFLWGGTMAKYENENKKGYKKNVGLKKNHIIKLRVTGEEKEQLLQQAEIYDTSMSDIVRDAIFTKKGHHLEQKRKKIDNKPVIEAVTKMTQATINLERQHRKIGTNINQAVKQLNEKKDTLHRVKNLDDFLTELVRAVNHISKTDDELLQRSDEVWRQLE
jgi:DNA repair ATPase RecN